MFKEDIEDLLKQIQNIILNKPEENFFLNVCCELASVEDSILLLSEYIAENKHFLYDITSGKSNVTVPKIENYLSTGLKELNTIFLNLECRAKQIANGDYSQKTNLQGEIYAPFNNMTMKLDEREQKIKGNIEKLQESYDKLKFILEENAGIVFEYDISNKTISNSRKFEEVLGISSKELNFLQNATDAGLVHRDDIGKFHELFCKIENGSSCDKVELRIKRADGIYVWYLMDVNTIYDDERKPIKAIGHLLDIAFVDKLTGVRNRTKFEIDAVNLMVNAQTDHVLVLLNVDKFKVFNDTFGYENGDELLKMISDYISKMLEDEEIHARYVADQFYILLKYKDDGIIIDRISKLYHNIEEEFKMSISKHYNLVLCSGVCIIENTEESFNTQSNKARYALREIKGSRKNNMSFYQDKIREQIIKEKEIEGKMHAALINKNFKLYLQPKYRLKDETVVGAEALVRWFDGENGLIYPNDFIPIFENNGFVIELDMYMLELSCIEIKRWIRNGFVPVTVSINFSRLHLMNENFVRELEEIVRRHSIPPKYIEIELTESTMFDNTDVLISVLNELHAFGFTISMDDFGSGYSSLSMLKNLPVDIIKLDRSFFSEYVDYARGKAVVESVIKLAKVLNITTVAEGVETKDHIDLLYELNCDIVQGYYFARPMPAKDFETKLKIIKKIDNEI